VVLVPGAPHTLSNFPAARHAVAGSGHPSSETVPAAEGSPGCITLLIKNFLVAIASPGVV
jgi:hypothetical protein